MVAPDFGYPYIYANDSAFHRQQLAERMNRIISEAVEVYEAAYEVAHQTKDDDDKVYFWECEKKLDKLCQHEDVSIPIAYNGEPHDFQTRCTVCGRTKRSLN